MTTKRIVYTRPAGGVSVIGPSERARGTEIVAGVGVLNRNGKVIVPERIDGALRLDGKHLHEETEAEFIARIQAKDVPAGASNVHVCDAAELPARDEFRNAWRQGAVETPAVDLPEAQAIQMARIRKARDAELVKLDVPSLRAIEAGDTAEQTRLAAEKQRLRDLPASVDLDQAGDVGALRAAWPAGLMTYDQALAAKA